MSTEAARLFFMAWGLPPLREVVISLDRRPSCAARCPASPSACLLLLTAACTVEPPAGTPAPPVSGTLERGPRETAFGRTGEEVITNPRLQEKIRNMFGPDWRPA